MLLPDHDSSDLLEKNLACSLVLPYHAIISVTNCSSSHLLFPTHDDFIPWLPVSVSNPTIMLGDLSVCEHESSNCYSHSSLDSLLADNLDLYPSRKIANQGEALVLISQDEKPVLEKVIHTVQENTNQQSVVCSLRWVLTTVQKSLHLLSVDSLASVEDNPSPAQAYT